MHHSEDISVSEGEGSKLQEGAPLSENTGSWMLDLAKLHSKSKPAVATDQPAPGIQQADTKGQQPGETGAQNPAETSGPGPPQMTTDPSLAAKAPAEAGPPPNPKKKCVQHLMRALQSLSHAALLLEPCAMPWTKHAIHMTWTAPFAPARFSSALKGQMLATCNWGSVLRKQRALKAALACLPAGHTFPP